MVDLAQPLPEIRQRFFMAENHGCAAPCFGMCGGMVAWGIDGGGCGFKRDGYTIIRYASFFLQGGYSIVNSIRMHPA